MNANQTQLSDQAYASLRRKLVLCEIKPGTWLSETQLQDLTGLPRTPTREATMRLVQEQMFVVYPRRGYQVADISRRSAEQLLDVFMPVLSLGAEAARGNMDPAVLTSIKQMLDADDDRTVTERMLDATEILVPAILAAAGNPWLTDTTLRIFSHVERLWAFSYEAAGAEDVVEKGFRVLLENTFSVKNDPELAGRAEEAVVWIREFTLQALERHLTVRERAEGA